MSLYVMADLHLSSDGSKSMAVFGSRWIDYMEKIRKNWCAVINEEDTVIIPGDISWALKLEDTLEDFRFLDSLPGKKLIGKGNHDFWWSTVSKMTAFLEQNGLSSIRFLYNNASNGGFSRGEKGNNRYNERSSACNRACKKRDKDILHRRRDI